jgi:hypothetical protein
MSNYGYIEGMRDMTVPDCAVDWCYCPMTEWDIYCEGHSYLTRIEITTYSKEF